MRTIERENRQNGNEEGSQEGTREEGSQEGTREESRKKEVVAVNQQQATLRGGRTKRPPQCLCGRHRLQETGKEPVSGLP
jgi:hypothetical protein